MPENLSVLQRATKAEVRLDPYPHIVIRDALPADPYAGLAENFPCPSAIGVDEAKNSAR